MPEFATIHMDSGTLIVVMLFAISAYIITIGREDDDDSSVIDESGIEDEDEEDH